MIEPEIGAMEERVVPGGGGMTMAEAFVTELTREADATRRVLERVPDDRLSWRPHEKSMSLGTLALHIAQLPLGIGTLISELEVGIPTVPLTEAASVDEILAALDDSLAFATDKLQGWGDEGLSAQWTMKNDGETLLSEPRFAMIRTLMLNHSYHHRGQLTVYLRLLGVPLPPIYGPTADEMPW